MTLTKQRAAAAIEDLAQAYMDMAQEYDAGFSVSVVEDARRAARLLAKSDGQIESAFIQALELLYHEVNEALRDSEAVHPGNPWIPGARIAPVVKAVRRVQAIREQTS